MLIRRETAGDAAAVSAVHAAAFSGGGPAEHVVEVRLVEALRASDAWLPRLSLVAVDGGVVVGHVVCTRADVDGKPALGLGPIGVRPPSQGRGVGSVLMHAVLAAAEALDESIVGVLGAPAYYRRFGFRPARTVGVESPDPTWGDAFQIRFLGPGSQRADGGRLGRFRYAAPFDDV